MFFGIAENKFSVYNGSCKIILNIFLLTSYIALCSDEDIKKIPKYMNKNIFIPSSITIAIATAGLGVLTLISPAYSQSNTSDNQPGDNLTKVVFLAGIVGAGALCWNAYQSRRRSKSKFVPIQSNSGTALLDRVSPKLRRQLLRLVNDPRTVNRLLMGIHKNNSDRSPNWIAEKVIYDLRRGR